MKTFIPATLIPSDVLASLTADELDEVTTIIASGNGNMMRASSSIHLFSENRGVHYLILNTPLKYSLISLSSISDEDADKLLTFDATRLDAYHTLMSTTWSAESGAWSQQFDLVMAALGNPNITAATAGKWIQRIIDEAPDDMDAAEVMAVIGSQLTDKWEPKEFGAAALGEIVRLFVLHGATYYAPQFKRWHRRKAKRA